MKKGFTLAEVLITLAIIGVVAAVAIPSVISNSNQQQYKTGLKKAVSVLNSAITMNIALEGETPYDNSNLMGYLMRHMSVLSTIDRIASKYIIIPSWSNKTAFTNAAFYTTDGMRFEFNRYNTTASPRATMTLYESGQRLCFGNTTELSGAANCGGCGSLGLEDNVYGTTKPPCLIMVDVNGDRKPNPENVNCKSMDCSKPYKFSDPLGIRLSDMFTIMITEKKAVPYGVSAQRAMYSAQKK